MLYQEDIRGRGGSVVWGQSTRFDGAYRSLALAASKSVIILGVEVFI